MPCTSVHFEGMRVIICSRGPRPRPKRCIYCGEPATCVCDFPQGKKTCDQPMCNGCATEVDTDLHQCREHCQEGLF